MLSTDKSDENANFVIDSGSNTAMLSNAIMRYSKNYTNKTPYALNEAIDEVESCENSGSVHYKGSGSEQSGGKVSMTFDNCSEGGNILDGSMNIDMKISRYQLESYTLTFPSNLTIQENAKTTTIFKNSVMTMNNFTDDYAFDMVNTIKVDVDGQLYGSENSKWRMSESEMYQLSGKEYIGNLNNFVTYDESYDMSKTPFIYSYYGLTSGEAHYIGENNGKIILEVTGSNELTVKVDADNDGIFETEEIISL